MFTDSRYIEVAQGNLPDFTVEEVNRENPYSKRINAALAELGAKTLGIEDQYLTYAEYRSYAEKLQAELVPYQKEISSFRQVKEDWELEKMRKAQDITDRAFTKILTVHPARHERERSWPAELIYALYSLGADGLSVQPIVVSGPKHQQAPRRPRGPEAGLRRLYHMDFGCIVDGYCSDMTRTVALGFVSDEMSRVYETVLRAQRPVLPPPRPVFRAETWTARRPEGHRRRWIRRVLRPRLRTQRRPGNPREPRLQRRQ